jgi:nucleoside-diphosphate-sugar epimerase
MILFSRSTNSSGIRVQIVALFGIGLVGSEIARALERCDDFSSTHRPLDWLSVDKRARELEVLFQAITNVHSLDRLDVVWSAGKAGFGALQEELDVEMRAFTDILNWACSLRPAVPHSQFCFHMLSSGGGLFEGQRFIDSASVPNPQRPYGQAKLDQEHLLKDAGEGFQNLVYRPSSIYGFSGLKGRVGLLNALIANARRHVVSRIFGDLGTVRDYVLSSDIGNFIARRIVSHAVEPGNFTLASGKPTSVKEMLEIAEKVTGRPLYIKLDPTPTNAGHITYRTSIFPADWHPTDLETGVRQVVRQISLSFDTGVWG